MVCCSQGSFVAVLTSSSWGDIDRVLTACGLASLIVLVRLFPLYEDAMTHRPSGGRGRLVDRCRSADADARLAGGAQGR